MAAKNKPYEQFGPYILFKKLESDPLGELWRAARIENGQIGTLVALRRLTGGDRAALSASATAARDIAPHLTGVTFAKHQSIDVQNDVPFIAHDYAGGRSLRHIVNRARGGPGMTPNPVPLDQAIVIAEKISLSLATLADLRNSAGTRLAHGALIPQFIWIDDGGEIRVAGQQLGKGIVASFKDAKVATEIGRYFPPEYRNSAETSKTTDVFSMGAILYLLVTGVEPPDAVTSSAFAQTVGAARTAAGASLPDDIRAILTKSLDPDPNGRYASMSDMKQAIAALNANGKYSATTFNLAFYLSNLLKKEMEGEALDRDKELKLNVAPYLDAPPAPKSDPSYHTAPIPIEKPMFGAVQEEPKKSKAPLAIAAGVIVAIGIGAGVMMMNKKQGPVTTTTATQANAAVPVAPPKPKIILQPVVAQASPATTTAAATSTADQQKAFETAVQQKYQEQLMKMQADFTTKLKQSQSKNAPVQTAAGASIPSQPAPSQPDPSAAALDAQKREAAAAQPVAPPTATQAAAQPAVTQSQPAAPAPVQVAAVREGDVIDVNELDTIPKALGTIRPSYSPIAQRQRVEGTVLLTALISETGQVLDVRVLKGVGFGLDEAAARAMKTTRFSPAMKDGKRVKTWFPQQITFKL
ncbi:MAG TPA: TonB family protein [Thermoanaerobaculia bacterium]|nr:TonB family protein [Thermoanaerobaculia bacterium]